LLYLFSKAKPAPNQPKSAPEYKVFLNCVLALKTRKIEVKTGKKKKQKPAIPKSQSTKKVAGKTGDFQDITVLITRAFYLKKLKPV
jgi:hypothetical protein